jgi:hypothetical protein
LSYALRNADDRGKYKRLRKWADDEETFFRVYLNFQILTFILSINAKPLEM